MSKEIFSPVPPIFTSTSFDGKHKIQFKESSHRYKWICACHVKKPSTGVTTFIKGGYPTSMGLISWMKGQSIEFIIKWFEKRGNTDLSRLTEKERETLIREAKAADKGVAQEAADIGTLVHDFAYLTELGNEGEAQNLYGQILALPEEVKEKVINGVDKFKAWKKIHADDELELSETLVASPICLFCGKFDRLVKRKGRRILGDFKTSKSMYLDQFIQLAAYRMAIKEWLGLTVDGLEVLRFGKDDGNFETLLVDDPTELRKFEDQAIRCRATHEFKKLENDPRWDWKTIKYHVCCGYATSINDYGKHLVTTDRLAKLYGLSSKEWTTCGSHASPCRVEGIIHLCVRSDGDYKLGKRKNDHVK